MERDVSHVNGAFRNHTKNTDDHLYKTEEKLRYIEETVLEEIICELRALKKKKLTMKPEIDARKK